MLLIAAALLLMQPPGAGQQQSEAAQAPQDDAAADTSPATELDQALVGSQLLCRLHLQTCSMCFCRLLTK